MGHLKSFVGLFFILLIAIPACTKKDSGPEDWAQWVNKKKSAFTEKFATPAIVHHIYLGSDGDKAGIQRKGKGLRFISGECSDCPYNLKRESKDKLSIRTKSTSSEILKDEKKELEKDIALTFVYSEDTGKVRVFLYDFSQKDLDQKRKRQFFSYQSEKKVAGKFQWLKESKGVNFGRSDGSQKVVKMYGKITFELEGKAGALHLYNFDKDKPIDPEESQVMLMFRDMSNGRDTYGAGRYLVVDFAKPLVQLKDGDEVRLDFNFSYNPPCAVSTGFHCPLPQDTIGVNLTVGEKYIKY